MTILVSDLGDTVVAKFKKWSDVVADFTVLPKRDIWQPFVDKNPWLQQRIQSHRARARIKRGFGTADPHASQTTAATTNDHDADADAEAAATTADDTLQTTSPPTTITSLAAEAESDLARPPTRTSLSRRLALSIQKVSHDLRLAVPKRYAYEEWVEFTRLIRYTTPRRLDRALGTSLTLKTGHEGGEAEAEEGDGDGDEEGLVNWDWLGEHSPMVAGVSEAEWLLERLVESLVRLERRKEVACDHGEMWRMRELEARGGGGPSTARTDETDLAPDKEVESRK